jgi:hypothetical protein
MITVYQKLRSSGINFSRNDLKKIGKMAHRTYQRKFRKLPMLTEQKEGERIYKVCAYPDRFSGTMDRLIVKYYQEKLQRMHENGTN